MKLLDLLSQGKKARLPDWNKGFYAHLNKSNDFCLTDPHNYSRDYNPSYRNLTRDDWEEYKPMKKVWVNLYKSNNKKDAVDLDGYIFYSGDDAEENAREAGDPVVARVEIEIPEE